jgi:adenylate cyclase
LPNSGIKRRLTAILAADVVGYSHLMGKDEAGTLVRLKSLHKKLIQPTISDNNGRIVKLMGDGLLAEFSSVVDAVQCAVEIQQSMTERETDLDYNHRIRIRIGINLGDIIIEGSDIFGDGVNIAARLEGLAEPGGICVSAKVCEEVKNKLSISFKDMGAQEVKNIQEPVRVYSWTTNDSSTSSVGATTAPPLPDKPSIAVLPFSNMSDDPEQEYFSDGITEDIITELSRFRSLFVIARNTSFTFKGAAVDVTEVGKKLGVSYVVEGSVRKVGNRVRITAQLIEATTGNHLWAERYDRELEDIFAVQDEVAQTISSTVGGRVESAGRKRAERLSGESLLAYDHVLRGIAAWLRNTKEDNRNARKHLEKAIDLDPLNPQAHRWFSEVLTSDWMAHWVEDRTVTLMTAYESAKTAIALDDSFSEAMATLGSIQVCRREYDDAQRNLERAIQLNPNDTQLWGFMATFL